MSRDDALTIIKQHQAELKKFGVLSLSLFGSTARGEAGEDSDVDVALRLEDVEGEGGFAYLRRMERVREYLSGILDAHVDVIAEPTSRPRLQEQIDRDRRFAF
jgi:hypothetical protein